MGRSASSALLLVVSLSLVGGRSCQLSNNVICESVTVSQCHSAMSLTVKLPQHYRRDVFIFIIPHQT